MGSTPSGLNHAGDDGQAHLLITSLDGYAEAAEGDLGRGAEDEEVHTFIGDLFRPVGTYLYGRRMYETMVFWETAHTEPDAPPHIVLPDGMRLDLELVEERAFDSGLISARYRTR